MRKTLSFYETKTLGSKTAPLHPFFGLNTLLPHHLKVVVERQAVPLHRSWNFAQISQKLRVGIGTIKCGTGTTWILLISFFGVLVPVCLVLVPLPLQMFPNTIALPKTSQQRLPSSAMIYIHSMDTNPYNNYARNLKNLHNSKNTRKIKGTYSYAK